MNKTLLETITHHTPAGASTPTVLHYAQEVVTGKQLKTVPLARWIHQTSLKPGLHLEDGSSTLNITDKNMDVTLAFS